MIPARHSPQNREHGAGAQTEGAEGGAVASLGQLDIKQPSLCGPTFEAVGLQGLAKPIRVVKRGERSSGANECRGAATAQLVVEGAP